MTQCKTRPPPPCAVPQPPSSSPPGATPRPPAPPSSRPPISNPESNLPLVLKECGIKVWITDVHSWVQISQQFQNPSSSVAQHVLYTFSMLAGAAVFDFQLIRQDGTTVDGVIKEKGQAQQEMNTAVKEGYTAALGEEVTKDIFSIGIGNVAGNETITIKLSYMSPLIDDEESDQLRFTLPRSYMERYGRRPAAVKAARLTHENVPFTIDVLIQQRGRIRSVTSPSGYNFTVGLGRPPNVDSCGVPDSNFATATVRRTASSTGRSRDVIIIISADRLDNPRAFIESHPSPNHSTAAIGLTLVPQFAGTCSEMEYIVLVDRSGSMEGVKLEMTRQAIIVLLQGLPSRGSYFNIFSYGSRTTSLWPRSRSYDQATVNEARRHLDSMQANYGGTEIAGALDAVFASLPSRLTRPVSIFLLTDGGVWDPILQNCVTKVEKAIADRTSNQAFMRVYTVGIGNGVSTETCDRIARAGGGISTYIVADNEQFIGKCTRLVRAARTPPIDDIKITWVTPQQNSQRDATGQTINLFDPSANDDCGDLGPLAPIMQAPDPVPSFYRSTRTQVYAIVPDSIAVSRELKLTGRIPSTGASVELTIPIQRFAPFSKTTSFMHTLAAKALIQDREDREQSGGDAKSLQEEIIRLGITYKLTSRYASLLAVDRRSRDVLGVNTQASAGPRRSTRALKADVPTAQYSSPFSSFEVNALSTRALKADLPTAQFSSSFSPFALSARSFTPGVMDTAEALIMLARLQKFDGGFDASSATEIEVALALDASEGSGDAGALGVVKAYVTNAEPNSEKIQEVYATLLAWAYMSVRCASEAYDMKKKADIWLKDNLGSGVDVDELERQFLEVVKFENTLPGNEFMDSDSDWDAEEEEE